MKPRIGITVGDFNGVGPEVILRSVMRSAIRRMCTPVLVGPGDVFRFYAQKLRLRADLTAYEPQKKYRQIPPRTIPWVENTRIDPGTITPGLLSKEAGTASANAIELAIRMAMDGSFDAIVTGPVSKLAMHMAGVEFPGQTEMLQRLTSSSRVAMMLVSRSMKVGLVTMHLPLSQVSKALTAPLLKERIGTIHEALVHDWRIKRPRIAVLALNPHAGEGGDLGREELDTIVPALHDLSATGMRLIGPLPADGFFARYKRGDLDAIVAMYHDQGLIPLKMSAAGRAVNVSVGLPIIRTSPDHGTGFDIAGKGVADPSSMIEAIALAVMIARNRKTTTRPD